VIRGLLVAQVCHFHFNLLDLDSVLQVNIYTDHGTDIPIKKMFSLCLATKCFISFVPNQVEEFDPKKLPLCFKAGIP